MVKLPKTINSITVPTTINFWENNAKVTRPITEFERKFYVNRVETFIAQLCGAYTTTHNISGGWWDKDNNVLVREESYTVWCYSKLDTIEKQQLTTFAQALGGWMFQDSILYVVNSQPMLT